MNVEASPAEEPTADSDQALEILFRDANQELLGTLYFLVGNIEDARDALQETFLKCWRSPERRAAWMPVRDLRSWVFRIALNTGRDMRRSAWHRRRKGLPQEDSMITTEEPPDGAALRSEELERLRRAISNLRVEEQEVFLLRQNGEMTYEEIAVATSLPLGTVKTRMRSALSQLRQVLGESS